MGLNNIQNYMIGVIVFMVLVVGGVSIFGTFTSINTDGADQLTTFNKSLNQAGAVSTSVNEIDNKIQEVSASGAGFLGLGWIDALIGSAFNGLKAIGGTLSFMDIVFEEGGALLGVPPFLIGLLTLIVTVVIVFAIWQAITNSTG
jgi:hypothetical protein